MIHESRISKFPIRSIFFPPFDLQRTYNARVFTLKITSIDDL